MESRRARYATWHVLILGVAACTDHGVPDGAPTGTDATVHDVVTTAGDGAADAVDAMDGGDARGVPDAVDHVDALDRSEGDATADHEVPLPDGGTVAALPTTHVLFGTFAGRTGSQSAIEADRALEAVLQRKGDIHRVYNSWDTTQPSSTVLDDVAHGRVPLLSISMNTASSPLTWASIASGAHDAEIRAQASGLASLHVPLFVIVNHEPEEPSTHHGTPAEYVAMWRHYVDVFRAQHVTNVTFAWVLVASSFTDTTADDYYPGDAYIDWIGADGYNWFGCNPHATTHWRTLEDIFAGLIAWNAAGHHKRIVLAEWGSIEDPADATRKSAWMADALAMFQRHPEIGATSYFDTNGTCAWWLDSTAATEAAYRTLGRSAYVHGNANAWLRASVTTGTAPLTVTFDASGSAGFGSIAGQGITGWSLDYGDGAAVVRGSGAPTAAQHHAYATGSHTAALTVTDSTGLTNTDHVVIQAR